MLELMPVVYSAVEAVAEGKADEIEVEHRVSGAAGEEVMTVIVRRTVRPWYPASGSE